jgi:hypothetical protein
MMVCINLLALKLKLHKKLLFLLQIITTMKHLFFLISITSIAFVGMSCKSKKETTASTQTAEAQAETFRLVVSFISKGAGPDNTKSAALLAYIGVHPKKPTYTVAHWGREGETDYCLHLTELTKSEQVNFVANVNKMMAGSDMVFVKENAESAHSRK